MNDYWVSLCNFRAKQMKELEAENEFLRNRCALQQEIIMEIKYSLSEEEEGAKVEAKKAHSMPSDDNNHSSSSITSSTSTTLCSPNTESSPSIYGTCTVAPLQSSTSFASFDSPPPGLIVSISQNSHNGGANSSSSSSHSFRFRELRARLMRLLCCCGSNNVQHQQPINREGQGELN
ncbi:hypothetical protein niasHT_008974 [Heterodera trifolii]|uniref:Uncharacterized protein n=1 Tax=Heterodera trifolii TaxID=157864 RepID=A0ABD2LW41_9BILA